MAGLDMAAGFRVPPQETLRVDSQWQLAQLDPTGAPGFDGNKHDGERLLVERQRVLADLQEKLFASAKAAGTQHSILLVLQGMDTAGKGGIVSHVIGSVDPQGVDHASFGVPTAEERSHDFLWRIRKQLPRAGQIGVFDRSHYEDVLVVRVHELASADTIDARYGLINDFEAELTAAHTSVIKVALFVSLDEQKRRLTDRLADPSKFWKYNPGDIDERLLWPKYQEAYQIALTRTSTKDAPWFAIPADRKWYARLAVTELLIERLERLNLQWPAADFDVEVERQRLAQA